MNEPKTPSNTERLNALLEVYKKNIEEQTIARDLLDEEIRKSKALVKDIQKVASKYIVELKEGQDVFIVPEVKENE